MAGRRAAARRRNWELGLEYRQLFERLRQRVDGGWRSCLDQTLVSQRSVPLCHRTPATRSLLSLPALIAVVQHRYEVCCAAD